MKNNRLYIPYLVWMILLVVIPILIMIVLAFSNTTGVEFSDFSLTLEHFRKLKDTIYVEAFKNSLKYSFITALLSLVIGYPVAYFLAMSNIKYKSLILVLLILPTWSNMLLRIIAWEKLFYPKSILNVIGISLDLIGTDTAIIIGMVSIYLPFMIFPIYAVLDKMDKSLFEAASDLGANQISTFLKVTLPLSLGGVVSGIIMTFLPSATAFALPQRLGGGKIILIGNIIESLFKRVYNYNFGSLLSIILLMIIFGAIMAISKVDEEGETLI